MRTLRFSALALGMLLPCASAAAQDDGASREPAGQQRPWEAVLEHLTLYGDLRLRHESSFELDDRPARNRERIRLRLGVNYDLGQEVQLGARLVTGDPDDPNSPHATFGDGLDSLDLSLDRAFLTYRPAGAAGFWLTGGKFSHPFYRNPVYGELVWDADVQPEGLLAGHELVVGGVLESVTLRVGEYLLIEQALASDARASVAQVEGRFRLGERTTATAAVSFTYYDDVAPDGSTLLFDDNAGNSTSGGSFESAFGILNPILAVETGDPQRPLSFAAEYIRNTRAANDQDQGWAVGASYGRTRLKGDWRLYYQWQVVEQDALFSPFAQDDFLFQTNHRSHLLGANYQLTDKVGLHLWGLVSARDRTGTTPTTDSDAQQWRIRLDLNVKF